ncbi:MAG: SRPBCC family protein [Bacteroidia bacterium]|nr:SRPBCC family protein [Bacteroidia bacterium]
MIKSTFKIRNTGVILLFAVVGLTIIIISFSPYHSHKELSYRAVKQTIEINAPVEQVFLYMGNSANATKWSVYVDHITPLNMNEYADGTAGCTRRCFTNAAGTGPTWDETIIITDMFKRRRLNIFNMVNFSLSTENLLTEQLYEIINENKCRLTLTLFLDPIKKGWPDQMKMYFTAYQINNIFARNLVNIKKLNEEFFTHIK